MSGNLKNKGDNKMAPIGMGLGTVNMVSVTMVLSWGKIIGAIVSSILKNVGDKMTALVEMVAKSLLGELDGTMFLRTLKNKGMEKIVLVAAGIKQWWGDFVSWWDLFVGQDISNDGIIEEKSR
ncbi:hypothetical protein ARMGADRAFT_1030000 [Armillaria gallica]|uniref:Uncharacterized protein n=1 Tax=Armillaria gallica TaxID=47427 RepID=A0A2H3DDN4_ARMGA|nr:hypothetical protein ARMGADRAFT_1030000 [Armillaria gallica]